MGTEGNSPQPLAAPGSPTPAQPSQDRPAQEQPAQGFAAPGQPGFAGSEHSTQTLPPQGLSAPGQPGFGAGSQPGQGFVGSDYPTQTIPPQGFAAPGQPGYAQPGEQGYPYPGAPMEPQQKTGKGLSIAALVVSIVALVLCLIPIINNFTLVLGVVGLGLGIAALVIASKRQAKKGMSIAALIMSPLAIIGAIVSQLIYAAMLTGIGAAIEESADGVVPVTEQEQQPAGDAPRMVLGEAAGVGDEYRVTVNSVKLDATEDILPVNPFNEEPQGQYVLVDLAVEYTGSEEGDPGIDLSVNFVGSDARQYESNACSAVVEKPAFDVPTLENGGKGDYQVCMDVPVAAVQDAQLFIEPTVSFDNSARVYWAVK
jgi:hypothetical protein